jgi:hypothetical protein
LENLKWIFDGIGTELIGLLIGLMIVGVGGYCIGVHKSTAKNIQKSGHQSTQVQTITSHNISSFNSEIPQGKK